MSDIERMLKAAAEREKSRPVSVNAEDLFFQGIITADEFETIYKGETVAMSIRAADFIPEDEPACIQRAAAACVDRLKFEENSNLDISYVKDVIQKAESIIDSAIKDWIPFQINSTVIRARRQPITVKADPRHPCIEVRITLIDVANKLQRTLGTGIDIPFNMMLGNREQDKPFWEQFSYTIHNQFTAIVLQIIQNLNTEKGDH